MVYFVGAGSGAPDLITVRGDRFLRQADVIIYAGSLVNPELLSVAKQGCQIHNSATMTLEEVIAVMLSAEADTKLTVRLHTGDSSIYGAVKEQFDELARHDIPFEVVPGVSSFLAAAASMQLEYTLPDVTQTVILTRMEGRTPVPQQEKIATLAKHQSSMAIFLSTGMTQQLQAELLEGGYPENTPAAIAFKVSWPDEKIYRCTVGTLAATASQYEISKTALVLVGNFIGGDYSRSKLYDPSFTTEFRKGNQE